MIDYAFYTQNYCGSSVPEDSFDYYAARAAEQMKQYKRMYTVRSPEENAEKMAVCAMMDALYMFDLIANGGGGPVQSASVGSVSESYGSAAANVIDASPKGQAKELYRCAKRYLEIYRGA